MEHPSWSIFITDEIISLFKEAQYNAFPLMLWQQLEKKRHYCSGKISEIRNDKVFFELIPDSKKEFSFLKSSPFFYNITGTYYNISGQSSVEYLSEALLILNVPDKVKFTQTQEMPIPLYADKTLNQIYFKITNKIGKNQKYATISADLLKLEKKWVLFFLVESGAIKMDPGDFLSFFSFPSQNVPTPFTGKVESVTYFHNSATASMRSSRVIVSFDTPFNTLTSHPLFKREEEKKFCVEETEKDKKQREGGRANNIHEKNENRVDNQTENNRENKLDEQLEPSFSRSPASSIETSYESDAFFGYSILQQQEILHQISVHDSGFGAKLKDNLDYLDRLRFLTPRMKQELFRQNDGSVLATALKLSTHMFIGAFLDGVSNLIRSEILFNLRQKKTVLTVFMAQKKIVDYVRVKESKGSFIFDKSGQNKKV